MASTYITKTFSGNGDRQKFTLSMWIKRSSTGQSFIFTSGSYNSTSLNQMYFDSSGIIAMYTYNSSGSVLSNIETNRLYRDTSGWYNIILRVDTTQSTASDRVRLYVNGVQETSLASTTYPSQNANYLYSESITPQYFGQRADAGNSSSFDGSMSHIHMCDGYSYDASYFGSTNSTTGQWEINTSPSVTYGTNGYFILKDGNSLTDESGNANNFAVGAGTLSNTKDNPSNVFCTWNSLNPYTGTIENGSLRLNNGSSFDCSGQGTIGMTSGKYYWEYKMGGTHGEFGVCEQGKIQQSDPQGQTGAYFIYNNGSNTTGTIFNNVSGSSSSTITVSAFANGMILGCAYDADNQALYFHQNGTYVNSGDPTSGASKTGAIITDLRARYGGVIVPFMGFGTSSARTNFDANFGNGVFGDTAISSAGTNASGLGVFEYDVPTGYTAVCTKGLNL